MKYTDLRQTISMMDNADYKERFKAEYYQETGPCIRAWSGLGTNAIIIIDSSLGTDPTSDTFKNGIKGMLLAYKKSS